MPGTQRFRLRCALASSGPSPVAEKRGRYEYVVTTQELDPVVDEVVGFSMGLCAVVRNGLKEYVEFADSPSGKRHYFVGRKGAVRIACQRSHAVSNASSTASRTQASSDPARRSNA